MNTARLLIERVLCDSLSGPGNVFERNAGTIDGELDMRRSALNEPALHLLGLLQTIEVRLTLGPYDPTPEDPSIACWRNDDADISLRDAIVSLVRYHFGAAGATWAEHAIRCLAD